MSQTHADARRRLDAARDHQNDMHEAFEATKGTLRELPAATELAAATEKTNAREAWMSWVESDY